MNTGHWRRRCARLRRAQQLRTHNPAALTAALRRLGGLS